MRHAGFLALALAGLSCATTAQAGTPIKGVGVSLGKIPGGGCATRTTDAAGKADFGVWPALPPGAVYTVTLSSMPETATVTITGTKGGAITRDITPAGATARTRAPISFPVDGKAPIIVVVEALRVKSHSNSANN